MPFFVMPLGLDQVEQGGRCFFIKAWPVQGVPLCQFAEAEFQARGSLPVVMAVQFVPDQRGQAKPS